MTRALVVCLSAALLAAAAPVAAGTVYVPYVDAIAPGGSTQATDLWISNTSTAARPFGRSFLLAGSDGTKRAGAPIQTPMAAGRTFLLRNGGLPGQTGLLEIDGSDGLIIEARLTSTAPNNGGSSTTSVPVISSENLLAAGATAHLSGLRRDGTGGDSSDVGVVNLGQAAAQCTIKFFRSDGSQIGATAVLTFQPLSMRHFSDAFLVAGEARLSDARAQVSCNQPFYAYATVFTRANAQLLFVAPAQTGASTLTRPGEPNNNPNPGSADGLVFTANGHLHTATTSNQKGRINVPITKELSLKRLIFDVDVVVGPWNRLKLPGNHALIYGYRGQFAGNTLINVNAFGPNKYSVKMNQNTDIGRGNVTSAEGGLTFEQGKRYHVHYVYDAQNNFITLEISVGGVKVKTLHMDGTARNGVLTLLPGSGDGRGLNIEFGHFNNQEGPELASFGWQYHDLKVQMIPY